MLKRKVIIADDEEDAKSLLKEYISDYPEFEIISECINGFETIAKIDQLEPDIVFLDIQMPKINGFEMLELIEEPPAVIFVTAFDEYAIRAFELHAVDYLLKPFTQARFEAAVEKAKRTYEYRQ